MPTVKVLGGPLGMLALMEAFRASAQEFNLAVTAATAIDGAIGPRVLFTIEKTTVALTPEETRTLAATLIGQSQVPDLEGFGRLLLKAMAELPGSHQGLH